MMVALTSEIRCLELQVQEDIQEEIEDINEQVIIDLT